jgi:hypothetical protein
MNRESRIAPEPTAAKSKAVAIALFASLTACAGGISSITPHAVANGPDAPATQSDVPHMTVTPSQLVLPIAQTRSVTVVERGYSGAFKVTSAAPNTCKRIASWTPARGMGPRLRVNVKGVAPGSCIIKIADTKNHNVMLHVTVSGASTASFAYTGAAQQFTVPDGVTQVAIAAAGATGGNGLGASGTGIGGLVTATIPVTPGEALTVDVGGAGNLKTRGFNGGGGGVDGGGSGGGASDVRQGGTALSDRVVVAGGGGGSGGTGSGGGGAGGLGGGIAGGAGDSSESSSGGSGGAGGTRSKGGAGGSAGAYHCDESNNSAGGNGVRAKGGAGGSAPTDFGGGGGGGGYYGGGGGGGGGLGYSSQSKHCEYGAGSGGGGGSGFAEATATNVTSVLGGAPSGNGSVTISW